MTLALWTSEPLDRLSSVLQHREEHGKATLDAVSKHGPIHEAEQDQRYDKGRLPPNGGEPSRSLP